MKHRYSDNVHNQRIAVLGPLPPPLGGVAVHIERVIQKLEAQGNTVYQFNSTSEWRYRCFPLYACRLFFFLLLRRPQLIIYHTTYLSNALAELRLLILCKRLLRFKIYLVEHDCRFAYVLSAQQKKQYQQVLERVDLQVLIGTKTAASFADNGLTCKHQSVESAFLPPDTRNEAQLLTAYPVTLHDFMQTHERLIVANAFQLSLFNNKDLYGFDQLVEAFARYAQTDSRAGLILLLAQRGDEQLYAQLVARITDDQLRDRVYLLEGNYLLWPLLKKVDLFVRPTLSDGASVSVEEALYCGVNVIASDVCWRPAASKLYKAGDVGGLYHSMVRMLKISRSRKITQLEFS